MGIVPDASPRVKRVDRPWSHVGRVALALTAEFAALPTPALTSQIADLDARRRLAVLELARRAGLLAVAP